MQPNESIHNGTRSLEVTSSKKRPRVDPTWAHVPILGLAIASIFALSGCEVVKGIFKVGAWFGALVVIAIVAVIGGVSAMLMRAR